MSTTLTLRERPSNRTLATPKNQASPRVLLFISHARKVFFTTPLLTRGQEPQWLECSAPRVDMLQRHLANCLKDKKKKDV